MRATHITLTCWVTLDQLIVKIQTYLSVERSARTQDSTQHSTAQGNVNVRVRYQARPGCYGGPGEPSECITTV